MTARRGLPRGAAPALVGLLAVAVYLPSLANGFALDDVPAVARDERIRDLANVPGLLLEPYLTYMPVERSPYRPLTTVTYALSWALGGGHPAAFHAVNVGLHAAATLLLLSLLQALGAGRLAAGIAAAVFAVHPVHVEAVAGVVGRADVLATLLGLAGLRLYVATSVSAPARVALVAAAYLLALSAKESAVVLPVLLLLLAAARPALRRAEGPEPGLGRRLIATWPYQVAMGAALAVFLVTRLAVLGGIVQLDVAAYIVTLPTELRITTAVANLVHLVRLLLFPLDLSPEYGPALVTPAGLADARFWFGASILLGAVALGVVGARRGGAGSWLALGLAWVAASYALVSNLVIPMPMWLAERTLYLPSVGVGLALVGLVRHVQTRLAGAEVDDGSRRASPALATVVALTCGLAAVHTWSRSSVWRSDEALFTDLVRRHPESFRAQWWLGGRMVDAGDVEGGLVWLERAVTNSPNSVLLTLDYVRGLLLSGRSEEAERLVRPIPPGAHPSRSVFLAQSLIFQGREEEAAQVVREGLARFPDEPRLTEQARSLGLEG